MVTEEFAVKKVLMGTIPEGEDLQAYMTQVISENGITAAQVTVLGAVSQANVGYFTSDS